jgi:Gametolysin peptidase M11
VIVANYRDATVACSVDAIRAAVFDDPSGQCVDALYRDMSEGQLWFSGAVVGPFTIDVGATDPCYLAAWTDLVDAQAVAAGVNLTEFSRKVYVMPPNTCGASGFGTVGGQPSSAWVFRCTLNGLFAHEMGHNLGMDHATTPQSEYGDNTDPLGFSGWELRGLSAPHRQQMGWLGPSSTMTVTQSGIYDIAPLARDPASVRAPRVITIAKPDTGEYYYLSYRLSMGFDTYIDGSYYYRVNVHRYKGDGGSSKTSLIAARRDGESFVDAINGITLTQLSHSLSSASVRIELTNPAPACVVNAPVVALAPDMQSGSAGDVRAYTVTLTNRDGSSCAATTFQLNAAAPAGWMLSASPTSVSVAPGANSTDNGQRDFRSRNPGGRVWDRRECQ